ncbi:MAG TPA: sulfite oxidase, partial [Acidimicrobiales bacterium]|nr:sulfite oxidase [Acidimicrobiales bacterium]
ATRNHGMPLEALRWPVTPIGLHYLLIHYDIPLVDPARWRLVVDGWVRRPLTLSLDDLRSRPAVEVAATMECAGNGRARLAPRPMSQPWLVEAVGTGRWRGTRLRPLLEEAGFDDGAREVVFTGMDRGVEGSEVQSYARSLTVADATADDVLLAYELNGQPLPPQHGFPLRLLVPGWYGMTNVKWLTRIAVVDEPFAGYQQARAYTFRRDEDDPGGPVTRMFPRALMVPPGLPDFFTRRRLLPLGTCVLEGRAWSGWAPVTTVEVSADRGVHWTAAQLSGTDIGPHAWQRWTLAWDPPGPGEVELWCRAADGAGNVQPTEPPWNLDGYANNAVQRVSVTVVR